MTAVVERQSAFKRSPATVDEDGYGLRERGRRTEEGGRGLADVVLSGRTFATAPNARERQEGANMSRPYGIRKSRSHLHTSALLHSNLRRCIMYPAGRLPWVRYNSKTPTYRHRQLIVSTVNPFRSIPTLSITNFPSFSSQCHNFQISSPTRTSVIPEPPPSLTRTTTLCSFD